MKSAEKLSLVILLGAAAISGSEASCDDIEKFDHLIAIAPSSELYFSRATARSRQGKHAAAVLDLDYALLLKPDDQRYLIAKAFELNRLSRFSESDQLCRLAASKRDAQTRFNWTELVLRAFNQRKIRLGK
jgi:hypothetical protein